MICTVVFLQLILYHKIRGITTPLLSEKYTQCLNSLYNMYEMEVNYVNIIHKSYFIINIEYICSFAHLLNNSCIFHLLTNIHLTYSYLTINLFFILLLLYLSVTDIIFKNSNINL